MRRLATRDWVIGTIGLGILVLIGADYLSTRPQTPITDFDTVTYGSEIKAQALILLTLLGGALITIGVLLAVMMKSLPSLFGIGRMVGDEPVSPTTPDTDWDDSLTTATDQERTAFR